MTAVDVDSRGCSVVVTRDGGRSANLTGEGGKADQLPLDSGAEERHVGDVGTAAAVTEAAPAAVPRRISFVVFGDPAPQGSKSAFRNQHTGRIQQVESSKKVKPWREAVKHAARIEVEARPDWQPLDGPLFVSMVFSFRRPRSHYRTGRNAHLLRDGMPSQPCSAPDLDKLARAGCDSIKAAGVIVDDARISEFLRLAKVWINEDQAALDVPGVRIEVREATR